jgi:cobalt-precorrin 5A hydrolase
MDLGKAMITAGIGCRRGSSGAAVVEAISHALATHGLAHESLARLATGSIKRDEPGIREAAQKLNLALAIVEDSALREASRHCLTHSERSIKVTGTASLSEAAALAGAGRSGKLLGPRIARDGVTCALARSEGDA